MIELDIGRQMSEDRIFSFVQWREIHVPALCLQVDVQTGPTDQLRDAKASAQANNAD